ncbi:MAG TPA: DUF1631 family protein [Usitatibacter sp.]|nr:DUF1631 family protein [Usitatibacter sp.]
MSQAILKEVRESLSRPFGDAMAARVPEVVELLEQQLAITEDRAKWKPLRGAIDLLRSLQPTLAKRVTKEVATRFDAKVDPSEGFSKTQRFTLDSLSLVADDQVQEEIALGNTTKRLKESLGDELFALTQRVANVMQKDDLGDDNNPVFPRIFARGLMDALNDKGSDGGSRLAAYSGFGPVVLEEVAAAYSATNQLLRDKGVLPDFKRSYGAIVQAQAPRRTAAAPATNEAATSAGPGGAGFAPGAGPMAGAAAPSPSSNPSPLDKLFAMASGQPVARPAIAATAAPAADGTVNINVRPELLEALKNLEPRLAALMTSQGVAMPGGPAMPASYGTAPAAQSFPASSAAVHQAKQEMQGSLTPDDVVVADLVAALFDRLFADTRLTDTTRAQVGRLQLPVFKAVLQDRSFFTDRRHPIRGLIDAMAELGATDEAVMVEGKPPSRWIANTVNEILERHAEDSQVFAKSLQKLTQVLERFREAALEQDDDIKALRDREVGLAAVREASLAIAHRLSAGSYAREVEAYLYGRFRQVMVRDFLNGGDNSPNWNADLEICDDILWVLTPRTTPEDRQRLVSLLPSLLFRLKMGYQRAGLSLDTASILVEELRQLLDEVMTSPVATAHGAIRKDPPPMPQEDYTATLRVSSGSLAEEGLSRGVWMEFTEDDGSKHRCRLNWMSPVQGTCVFKDLEKNRSFAISVDDLRDRRRNGKAVIVDGPGIAQSTIDGAIADVARTLGTPQ